MPVGHSSCPHLTRCDVQGRLTPSPYVAVQCAVEDASSGSGADANSTLASAFPSCCGTVEPISEQPDQRSHPAAKELLADQSSHPAAKELLADQSSHPEAKELLAELSKEALVLTTGGVAGVGPTTRIHNIAMRAVKLGRKVAEQVLGAIRRCLRWALEHNNWSVLCTITLDFDAGMKDLLRSLGCPDKVIRCVGSTEAGWCRVGRMRALQPGPSARRRRTHPICSVTKAQLLLTGIPYWCTRRECIRAPYGRSDYIRGMPFIRFAVFKD